MKLPDAMREARGGEPVTRAVALDGDDILATTPTRTLVYHGEGILSDESIDEFPHDVERLTMSEGRRKTTFTLTYVDGEQGLTVPSSVTGDVLDALLEGVCTAAGILDADETVAGTFRFSELTLIVADHQIVKHVGGTVWDEEFETFRYERLSDLEFEQLGGAMEIVLELDGRPQRIKTPDDRGRVVEETIKAAVFDHYDVQTMAEFRSLVTPTDDESGSSSEDGLNLDSGIDPLGGTTGSSAFDDPLADDSSDESPAERSEPESTATESAEPVDDGPTATASESSAGPSDSSASGSSDRSTSSPSESPAESPSDTSDLASTDSATSSTASPSSGATEAPDSSDTTASTSDDEAAGQADAPVDREDVRAMIRHIDDLTEVIEQQNRLLSKQHEALKQLATEVRDPDD